MRIWTCGVRGSTPTPGVEFDRYGGHTSCLAIAHDGEPPSLIVDAGTGIRLASDLFGGSPGLFDGQPYEGAILLGHLHWDHTQGLPFFAAGNSIGSRVDLYAPAQGDTESVLERFMSPPHFPIAPKELLGSWSFHALEPGPAQIAGFSVLALEIPHKGGRAFGYRISDGRASIAYLSDHCPTNLGPGPEGLGEYHEAALSLARGCDVLFHDAQYTDEELPARASFGHASCGYAVGLAERAQVGQLMLYHHDPARTDEQIDSIVTDYKSAEVPVSAAVQGTVLDLP
ncbi:MAG: MBL fold metallo-hydrolase [Acidimicrobiales bacterium]|jgi:phosphoribosyl 1,2-cyclic phosphodiesterase